MTGSVITTSLQAGPLPSSVVIRLARGFEGGFEIALRAGDFLISDIGLSLKKQLYSSEEEMGFDVAIGLDVGRNSVRSAHSPDTDDTDIFFYDRNSSQYARLPLYFQYRSASGFITLIPEIGIAGLPVRRCGRVKTQTLYTASANLVLGTNSSKRVQFLPVFTVVKVFDPSGHYELKGSRELYLQGGMALRKIF